jgi:hypothetical protein
MKKFALIMSALVFLTGMVSPAMADFPQNSPPQDSAPFNDPSVRQLGPPSSCNLHLTCAGLSGDTVLQQANLCAHNIYGFTPTFLAEYRTGGDYDKCAMPTSFQPQVPGGVSGKAQWPVCCLTDRGDGTCDIQCIYQFVPNK